MLDLDKLRRATADAGDMGVVPATGRFMQQVLTELEAGRAAAAALERMKLVMDYPMSVTPR